MALTREFKATVQARARRDPAFRAALLREGVEALLSGDVAAGKIALRDYIKATVGFEAVAKETGHLAPSLVRMFGPSGNPRADNLFAVIGYLQKREGVTLAVKPVRSRSARKAA
jgi:DNA-binding phage protein